MSILAAHNDDDAPVNWADVVETNEPYLRRLIAKRMANRDLVDDALQETYLRAVRSCRVGRGAPDGPWLRTVARRASTDLYRGEPPPMADLDALAEAADGMLPGSDEHLDSVERRAALRWSLARLSPRHRRLLALRGVHDLSYQQIGVIENLSEEAVTAALNRARTRLRAHLYAYENRRTGAAAGLVLGHWLRRLRWRLQEMGPRAMEWAGAACTVGVVTAIVATPVHAPAQNNSAAEAGVAWTDAVHIAHPTDVPAGTGSVGVRAGHTAHSAAARDGTAPTSGAAAPLVVTRPDVQFTSEDAVVRYGIDVNDPLGGESTDVFVEVHCTKSVTATVTCAALRALPESS